MLQKSVVRFPYGWCPASTLSFLDERTWPLKWLLVDHIANKHYLTLFDIGTFAKIVDDKCYFIKIENENNLNPNPNMSKLVLYAADHDDYVKALNTDYSEYYDQDPYHANLERLKDLKPVVGREAVEYFIRDFNIKGVEILDESEIVHYNFDPEYPYEVEWDITYNQHSSPQALRSRGYSGSVINL